MFFLKTKVLAEGEVLMFFKPAIFGFLAALGLIFFYFAVLIFLSGWNFARMEFFQDWYWIIGLSTGFGTQIFLFTYLKSKKNQFSSKGVIVSGTVSGTAMIACCSHYLANILPFVGIAGAAALLGQYQTQFFIVSLIANIAGIIYMVKKLIDFNNAIRKDKTI